MRLEHRGHTIVETHAGLEGLEPRLMLTAATESAEQASLAADPAREVALVRRARAKRAASRFVVKAGTVLEGNPGQIAKLTFTVLRRGDISGTASVRFRASPSGEFAQASAGADFAARAGKLNFAPGVRKANITVNVFGDNNPEFDESVRLDLFAARGASILTPAALGTILDDDSNKEVDVSITADDFNPDPNQTYPPTLLPVTLNFRNFGTAASGQTRVQFFAGNFDDFNNLTGYVDIGSPILVPSIPGGTTLTQSYVLDFNQAFIFNDSWSAFARVLIEDTNMTNNTRYLGDIQLTSNNT